MGPETENKLFTKYPEILGQTLMGHHIECGDGWYDLIDYLCDRIKHALEINPEIPKVQAWHVTKQVGGLRFYCYGGNQSLWKTINDVETESYSVCEECGARGSLNYKYNQIKCLCPEHTVKTL